MNAYINGAASISAQHNDTTSFLEKPVYSDSDHFKCQEPDYKIYIQPALIRRMSRILKMGVASAQMALNDAEIEKPDAILTGTGLGCIEDTEKFLGAIIQNKEQFLTPTSFIQSTHNTVGGQIALMLKCNAYNFTYVHRAFSFESCLLDAMMLLNENKAQNILVGATDELTNNSLQILRRLHPAKETKQINYHPQQNLHGEGANFFVLSKQKNEHSYAQLIGCKMIYKPSSPNQINKAIQQLLAENQLKQEQLDLILLGRDSDFKFDQFQPNLNFPNAGIAHYKHLSGEYHTANAFGFYAAARILKNQSTPEALSIQAAKGTLKYLLIYNQYQGINHSLLLLRAC